MDLEKAKAKYKEGTKLSVLSKELGMSLSQLKKICYKEKWKHSEDDRFRAVKESSDTVARLIRKVSQQHEDIVDGGGKVDARDIKYITAAQKELLEVMRDVYEMPTLKERNDTALEREKFIRAGEKTTEAAQSGGVVLLPEVELVRQ